MIEKKQRSNRISRRGFTYLATTGTVAMSLLKNRPASPSERGEYAIHLGGPVMEKYTSPEEWVALHKKLGYSAAYCPVGADQSDDVLNAYAQAAKAAGIIIAEVGAWSNPMDRNEEKRKQALAHCQTQLALAERIGARCCVNISGSLGEKWDGHHPDNLTEDAFDRIVETTRTIIDAVKPQRTFYTLETMPWAYPDSVESYVRLIKAIDRKGFAVHFDPANLICSPQRYYANGAMIRECFEKLGPYIRSCHAKDILMDQRFTVHLDEVRPGLGNLDYKTFLTEVSHLPDVPVMLEHLSTAEDYRLAAEYVRSVGKELGLVFG